MTENQIIPTQEEMWAVVELMGHGQTAGRIEKPTEWGGLMRVDVPDEDGSFRTELYGIGSIYSVKFVSEEIARAYAPKKREITTYDAPIVTREQYNTAVRKLNHERDNLLMQIHELRNRLTKISSLPASTDEDEIPL